MEQKTRSEAPEIKVGNVIEFTNKVGYKVKITVSRVDEKSWYDSISRQSYGSLLGYSKYKDFKIS